MCCTFITTSECVSECFSLRVDRSLTKTNEKKTNYINECAVCWMCFTIVPESLRVYTHTWMLPWCVVFFDILWFCRATYTRVCWMCVLYVFFSFFFFWRVVQFNKVLNVTVKVRSKLWPGWRDFSSLGGVFTTTICQPPQHAPTQTASVCF